MINWTERLEDGLFQKSRSMSGLWGSTLRLLRYPAAITRDWIAGEISVRAMSLAYTTLLSLVPLMVFSFAILKGLGARSDLRYILLEFFKPLGGAADQLTESVMQFVTNMRGDVLGSIGLTFLVYTVVTTIQKVEASFNFVWRVERPRSFARRMTGYLSVMIVGPVLVAIAVGLLSSAEDSVFVQWLAAIAPIAWVMAVLGRLLPYAIITLVFTFMYAFVPNTRVDFKAAAIGGVTAGIIWALVGKVFASVIFDSSRMMAIYTGFAIVLTTLVWVYLNWLILLIGAELAFYVQFPQYLRHGQEALELTGYAREQTALSAMLLVGREYSVGGTLWTTDTLAAELDIPPSVLASVLTCLEEAGLILATEHTQLVPARALAGIPLSGVIDAIRTRQSGKLKIGLHPVASTAKVMAVVEEAIREHLAGRSLQDLVDSEVDKNLDEA